MSEPSAFDPWWLVGVFLLGVLILLGAHVAFPRYDWRPVGDGHAVMIYDRWSGRFQRAEWNSAGKLLLMDVYTAP